VYQQQVFVSPTCISGVGHPNFHNKSAFCVMFFCTLISEFCWFLKMWKARKCTILKT
jgi:hypothetical protein